MTVTQVQMKEEPSFDSVAETKQEATMTPVLGFIFFGMVGLLCYNYFLQILEFFDNSFAKDFSYYATIIYGFSNNCGQLVCVFYGSRLPFAKRIYYSCTGLSIVLVLYGIVAVCRPSSATGMSLGLILTFGLGLFNALLQSAGFGLAGICSPAAMKYFCLGQALCGLAPWPMILLLNLIFSSCGLSTDLSDEKWPSQVMTASSMTSLVFAAVLTLLMVPFYRFSLSKTAEVRSALAAMQASADSSALIARKRPTLAIVKSTLPLALAVWFVLYVTFVVFPSHLFKWTPSYGPYPVVIVYPCMMIYVFQVFDVVGRYMPAFGIKLNYAGVKLGSLLRAALIPLFYLATHNISFFSDDFTRIVLMAIFAATNGLVLTWGMINGPSQVEQDERDVASYTMSFFLVNGIFCGSMTALIVDKIIAASA